MVRELDPEEQARVEHRKQVAAKSKHTEAIMYAVMDCSKPDIYRGRDKEAMIRALHEKDLEIRRLQQESLRFVHTFADLEHDYIKLKRSLDSDTGSNGLARRAVKIRKALH